MNTDALPATPLEAILKARIAAEGPLPLEVYMAECLSHPEHGYYTSATPFGAEGDFITAPDISQLFGELLGAWLAQAWVQLGAPAKVVLVEMGPGRGTLMADALRATRNVAGFHSALSVHLVESSPRLQATQRAALVPHKVPLFWHETLDTVPNLPLLFVANELVDALPIRQRVRTPDGAEHWREVGLDHAGNLAFLPPAAVVAHEECPAAAPLMRSLSRRIAQDSGAAILIDYGYHHAPEIATVGNKGVDTLQAMRHHAFFSPLEQAGAVDLTAHVDFGALAQAAARPGVQVLGPIPQGIFLDRLGGEFRLHHLLRTANQSQADALISGWRRLTSPSAMGTLFKVVACVPDTWDDVAGFHRAPPQPAQEH